SAGQIFHRTSLILDHMRFGMGEDNAARAVQHCHRERVGGCSGGDEEDCDLTFKNLIETAFNAAVQLALPIGGGKTRCLRGKCLADCRMGSRPVVGRKVHEWSSRICPTLRLEGQDASLLSEWIIPFRIAIDEGTELAGNTGRL